MEYVLPLAMLFGFLTMHVRRGDDFATVMPVVMLLLVAWSVVTVVYGRSRNTMASAAALVGVGVPVVVASVFADVATYDALGPSVWGAPLVLAVVWATTVLGVGAIALRVTRAWWSGVFVALVCACAWAAVVATGLFHVGAFAYRTHGIVAGIPLAHVIATAASVAGGVAGYGWLTRRKESALPLGVIGGPLLLAGFATGVCIAVGAWVPAVLGLVLVQLGFRAMYYL